MIILLLCVVALVIILGILLASTVHKPLPIAASSRCLLLTAHPDDECMFFGPTIINVLRSGCHLHLLCITTGNADGLGSRRKDELYAACQQYGINANNITIMQVAGLEDGQVKWDTEKLARIVLQHIERLDIDSIITFDQNGVSGHSNHAACFHAVQFLYTHGLVPADVQIFVLVSVSTFRKYISVLDVFMSFFKSTFMLCAPPWPSWAAMREHRTQLVWFRYLYLLFSRYLIINTLKRISLHRLMLKKN